MDRIAPRSRRERSEDHYTECCDSYTGAELAAKEAFVLQVLERRRPRKVLDAGCNFGHFSLLAAREGAEVVAVDRDPVAIATLWKRAGADGAAVLPLVVNISQPSPSTGWENSETPSFLNRARGQFDCVLMLALIHHLMVNERVPLTRILDLASDLTTDMLIVEYIDPADKQFRQLARGRESMHHDLTKDAFESALGRCFGETEVCDVSPTRRLYAARRKAA